MEMMPVAGGTYVFGSDGPEIQVADFRIGAWPVTNAEWAKVMGGPLEGEARSPKVDVSWDEVRVFLERGGFRLPLETEWEYAARGGPHWRDGFLYSGSNDIERVAWYDKNSGDRIHPVALKEPNQLGLYDLSGNVWEWCQDKYGGAGTDDRALRGGCFHNWAMHCTATKRYEIERMYHDGCIGFRVVAL